MNLTCNAKGSKTNIEQIDEGAKYSWLKSPRCRGNAMDVGPLARYRVAYPRGQEDIKAQVDGILTDLGLPITALFSTLGRTAARTLETKIVADAMQGWFDELIANIKAGDTATARRTTSSMQVSRTTRAARRSSCRAATTVPSSSRTPATSTTPWR